MFQAQNRETILIVLEKLLYPSRSLWRRAWQDRVSQHNTRHARPRPFPIFWSQTDLVLRPTVSDQRHFDCPLAPREGDTSRGGKQPQW